MNTVPQPSWQKGLIDNLFDVCVQVTFTSKSEDEELEEEVACQISPVFNKDGEISNQEYEFTFLGKI